VSERAGQRRARSRAERSGPFTGPEPAPQLQSAFHFSAVIRAAQDKTRGGATRTPSRDHGILCSLHTQLATNFFDGMVRLASQTRDSRPSRATLYGSRMLRALWLFQMRSRPESMSDARRGGQPERRELLIEPRARVSAYFHFGGHEKIPRWNFSSLCSTFCWGGKRGEGETTGNICV